MTDALAWEPQFEDEEHPPQVCCLCSKPVEDGEGIIWNYVIVHPDCLEGE